MSALPPYAGVDKLRLEIEAAPAGLPNLAKNPSGELGAWAYITPVANTNLFKDPLTPTLAFQTSNAQACNFTTEFLPVAATKYVGVRFDQNTITSGHNLKVTLDWYDTNKALLSSSTQGGASAAGTNYSGPVQAPASTAYVKVRWNFYNGTGNPAALGAVTFSQVMVTWANTAGALATTRTNLARNPSAATTSQWGSYGIAATLATVTTPTPQAGTTALAITQTNTGSVIVQTPVTITGGQTYTFSAYVREQAGNGTYQIRIQWQTSSSAPIFDQQLGTATSVGSAGWVRISGTATAPSNAAGVQAGIQVGLASGGTVHYLDAFMVEQGNTLGAYFDGASTGSATYAWTGTANASSSTESTSAYAFTDPYTWRDILGPTHEISIDRHALDVGVLQASILDALLDPAVTTDITPGKLVRMRVLSAGAWESIFEGRIDRAEVSYDRDDRTQVVPIKLRTEITLTATDNTAVLANQGESRGVATIAALPYILEGKGVPWNVNGSGNQVSTATVLGQNENASTLDQVAVTRDTVRGYAWVNRRNVLTAYDAGSLPSSVVASFTDVAGGLGYTRIDAGFSTQECINEVTVTWLRYTASTGETEEIVYGPYRDQPSISQYGAFRADFKIYASTDAGIPAFAAAVLAANKTPVRRAAGLSMPVKNAASLAAAVAVDLYSPVSVVFSTILNATYPVTSVKHTITPEKWTVDYGFTVSGAVAAPAVTPSPIVTEATDGTWITPTLQGTWANYGAAWSTAGYMRKNGVVYLRGLVKSGATASTVFVLPAGYRPAMDTHIPAVKGGLNLNATSGSVDEAAINVFAATGNVTSRGTTGIYLSLDGISFVAEG